MAYLQYTDAVMEDRNDLRGLRMKTAVSVCLILLIGCIDRDAHCDLTVSCYPNATIVIRNLPDMAELVYAMQFNNSACAATKIDGDAVLTGCYMGEGILVMLSNFSGIPDQEIVPVHDQQNHMVTCRHEQRNFTVYQGMGVELVAEANVVITPTIDMTSSFRLSVSDSDIVTSSTIGNKLFWTIDVPEPYSFKPLTCTAYAGLQVDNTVSKTVLLEDGCTLNSNLMTSFDVYPVRMAGGTRRYYAEFYVFKFYSKDNIVLSCEVRICPSGSPSCATGCSDCITTCRRKKRRASHYIGADAFRHGIGDEADDNDGSEYNNEEFETRLSTSLSVIDMQLSSAAEPQGVLSEDVLLMAVLLYWLQV